MFDDVRPCSDDVMMLFIVMFILTVHCYTMMTVDDGIVVLT
jgi:hypothetical protein